MSEQVRVLKDEVRRLENNKERQQHAENLEYLKNVFIKVSFYYLSKMFLSVLFLNKKCFN